MYKERPFGQRASTNSVIGGWVITQLKVCFADDFKESIFWDTGPRSLDRLSSEWAWPISTLNKVIEWEWDGRTEAHILLDFNKKIPYRNSPLPIIFYLFEWYPRPTQIEWMKYITTQWMKCWVNGPEVQPTYKATVHSLVGSAERRGLEVQATRQPCYPVCLDPRNSTSYDKFMAWYDMGISQETISSNSV